MSPSSGFCTSISHEIFVDGAQATENCASNAMSVKDRDYDALRTHYHSSISPIRMRGSCVSDDHRQTWALGANGKPDILQIECNFRNWPDKHYIHQTCLKSMESEEIQVSENIFDLDIAENFSVNFSVCRLQCARLMNSVMTNSPRRWTLVHYVLFTEFDSMIETMKVLMLMGNHVPPCRVKNSRIALHSCTIFVGDEHKCDC